jgi:catechol 2,3-dioxygenase-like lactoylglutathione lyase family enzyme
MHDVGLTHVALPVADLDTSIAFYAKYAGMQVVHRRPGAAWISDRTRPFVIVLLAVEKVEHPLRPFAHLGVGCQSRDEVDRLCGLARDEGCLVGGPNDYGPPVGYWAFVRDPDGHTLEVSFGQEVAMSVAMSQQAQASPAASSSAASRSHSR